MIVAAFALNLYQLCTLEMPIHLILAEATEE
jgi:hypothetical protein